MLIFKFYCTMDIDVQSILRWNVAHFVNWFLSTNFMNLNTLDIARKHHTFDFVGDKFLGRLFCGGLFRFSANQNIQ